MLSAVAWVMLRYSRTLPIGKFFAYSSVLVAILAVVLAGKGTADAGSMLAAVALAAHLAAI